MNAPDRLPTPIDEIRLQLGQMRGQFEAALPSHIPLDRFCRVVMTAVQNAPGLMQCDRRSLWNACVKAATDGLLPDGREGAIVVRGGKNGPKSAMWQPMIAGIRKKVRNSGEIATWDVHVVHQADVFRFRLGDDPLIEHEPSLDDDPGPTIAAYSVCVLKTGEKSRDVMSIGAIRKIRDRSDAWKAYKSGAIKATPWLTDEDEMAKKTVARRHSKVLPMSTDIEELLHRDDEQFHGPVGNHVPVERTKTLAGRLDALAALTDQSRTATAVPEVQASADNGEVVDAETGEVIKASNAEVDQSATEIDEATAQTESPGQQPRDPDDEASYQAWAEWHIDNETNAANLKQWFINDEQKKLRTDCKVAKVAFDSLRAKTDARIRDLAKKGNTP